MSNDWIEHNGGPQPVADDVWVSLQQGPDYTSAWQAHTIPWQRQRGYRVLNQHLIDAARLEGIRLGLEAAEKYNRRAFDLIVDALRNTNPDTIAREAALDQLTREAQADNMGYDND